MKVKRLKGEKVKRLTGTAKPTITLDDVHEDVATWENQKVEKRTAKPKMTAEQKACLAACKSLDADVERAKEITSCAEYVLRELCKSCKNVKACKKLKGLPMINCRMSAIMGVSIGMFQEERKATLETTWELLHGQMAALKANQEGGAK